MATTIQQIELPKKARAVDTSSGWQTVGSNLSTNGDFATGDFTGWLNVTQNSGAKSIVSGAARLDATAASDSLIQIFQDMGLVSGKRYRITFTITNHNGDTSTSSLINNSGSTLYAITGNGVNLTFDFTHSISDPRLFFRASNGSKYDIDNISVLELQNFPNNNHGQIYSGRGLEFDGVSDYLTADSIAPFVHSDFTSSFWINPTLDGYTTGPGGRVIWSAHSSTNANILLIVINGTSNSIRTYSDSAHDISSTTTALLQGWQRVVIMKSGTSFTVYVNGILNGTSTIADNVTSGAGKFSIGQEYDGSSPSDFYLGMMSDFQVWDTLWTAADVTYDYLNPESLALNNSGTALTESNLKLWYPMQDGHRGQQSYILDGANTGLGVEKVTNGDFNGGTTGWTIGDAVWQQGTGNGEVKFTKPSSGNAYLYQTGHSYEAGVVLRYRFSIVDYSGSSQIRIDGYSGANPLNTTTSFLGSNGDVDVYITTDRVGSGVYLYLTGGSVGDTITIDNVSVQVINDKNHATTVFYGDEEVVNGEFTNNITDGWTVDTTRGSYAHDTGRIKITNNAASSYPNCSQDIATVIGRTYRVRGGVEIGTATTVEIRVTRSGDNASQQLSADGNIDFTFVADQTSTKLLCYLWAPTGNTAEYVFFDNISFQEVGVATGWTDADQQLHIPQTALQSYNELAWFDGYDDSCVVSNNSALDVGTGDFSISFWVNSNGTGTISKLIDRNHTSGYSIYDSSTALKIGIHGSLTTVSDSNINDGKWHHIVVAFDRSGNASVYKDGVKIDDIDISSDTEDLDNSNNLVFGKSSAGSAYPFEGAITEVSLWKAKALSATEVLELFNDGKALDARLHSGVASMTGYWRNNGLSTWTDLKGSNDGAVTCSETILIPQGVDSTRDAQGFIMNNQKDTSCLNFPTRSGDYAEVLDYGDLDFGTGDFSYECWVQYGFINNSDIGGAASGLNVVFSNGHASSSNTRGFNLLTNSSKFLARIGDGAKEDSLNIQNRDDDGDAVSYVVGDWYHIAVTRTGTTLRSYVDGAPSDYMTNMESDISVSTDTPFRISDDTVDSRDYKWPVDGVRLYSKELSDTEVLKNYKATKGNHRN